ncbi:hypothetical protein [Pseudorhodoplanes sp.]|uniref:hypothetical protein n=1 Tax=Pseudorhodoplanes sp. TaxID=1934341 RepID=UPI003D12C9F2
MTACPAHHSDRDPRYIGIDNSERLSALPAFSTNLAAMLKSGQSPSVLDREDVSSGQNRRLPRYGLKIASGGFVDKALDDRTEVMPQPIDRERRPQDTDLKMRQ